MFWSSGLNEYTSRAIEIVRMAEPRCVILSLLLTPYSVRTRALTRVVS
jgi:hypothetical protein